jgi:hypothetical protein
LNKGPAAYGVSDTAESAACCIRVAVSDTLRDHAGRRELLDGARHHLGGNPDGVTTCSRSSSEDAVRITSPIVTGDGGSTA